MARKEYVMLVRSMERRGGSGAATVKDILTGVLAPVMGAARMRIEV